MILGTHEKEIYIFIGPPGAGKGSLAAMCVEQLGWSMLSAGNLCRKHVAEQTEIGKEIDFAIKSGKLISDELISQMVERWFVGKDEQKAVILDGYPRTLNQARTFSDFLKNNYKKLKLCVVQLVVADDTVIDRLASRFTCANTECQATYSTDKGSSCAPKKEGVCDKCGSFLARRVDDDVSAFQKRLQVYYHHIKDLLDFYRQMGYAILDIDVEKPLELVFEDFVKRIGVMDI